MEIHKHRKIKFDKGAIVRYFGSFFFFDGALFLHAEQPR